MGRYIDQDDLELEVGASTLAQISDLESSSADTPDADRIASAIDDTEQMVEDRFEGSVYQLPFSGLSDTALNPIKRWCRRIAIATLYEARGGRGLNPDQPDNPYAKNAARALEEMDNYLAGTRRLNCARKGLCQTGDAPSVY